MKCSRLLYIMLVFSLIGALPVQSAAQTCGTREVHEKMLREHPEFRSESSAIRSEITTRIASQIGQRNGFAIYTIPVVVHVIHLGESVGSGSNISDAQVIAAINGLNDGQLDPANCEDFYIQNYAISAFVTLHSKANYECNYTNVTCPVTISGAIRTETNLPVSGVSVVLSGSESDTIVTGIDGLYSFTVAQGGSYTVTPFKNNDLTTNNGVTTADIALIRRHVLGTTLLDSPYKIIAADGSNSETISTADIPSVRIVVLNDKAKFPPSGSRLWEFISGYNTASTPFPVTKTRTYANITESFSSQDFIVVKIGDVNNSWNPTNP